MTILRQETENVKRITTEYWSDDYKAIIQQTVVKDIYETFKIFTVDKQKLIATIDYSILLRSWYMNGIYIGNDGTEYNFNRFYSIAMSIYESVK